jgi:hypothetical protein
LWSRGPEALWQMDCQTYDETDDSCLAIEMLFV